MATSFDLGAMLGTSNNNQIQMISCDRLVPYHNHKFTLYSGERLDDMIDSIRRNGILIPIIVQPLGNEYEILVGHNRWNAGKLAGMLAVPCIVKSGLSDDEAEMYVIESNVMQRGFDNLKISEQAEVLKMRHSKMFSQGKRNDIIRELEQLENSDGTSSPMDTKLEKGKTAMDKVGEEYGMSRATVARLLRIAKCCDNIKAWVDNNLIPIRVGVDLSYLTEEEQELITYEDPKKLNMKVSVQLKERAGTLTEEDIDKIVNNKLQSGNSKKPKAIKIEYESYSRFFAEGTKADVIQDTIVKALEAYFKG